MPQSVFIQVGQCGNQVGFRFWQSALKEYNVYSDSLSGILIDMEEGVISEGCRGPLGKLFNKNQILTDVSGCGNNWAVGNKMYGRKYLDSMINLFRKEAEDCDNLESFLMVFSMGGGTGSGLGTAALECLHNEFPKIPRLVFSVFPSEIDDVITSPYNAVLANSQLAEHAKYVIPFENQALHNICMTMDKNRNRAPKLSTKVNSKFNGTGRFTEVVGKDITPKPFDDMNDLISNAILDFTSSARFPGTLNVDISDIIVNMTPFPGLHYLVSSTAPFIFTPDDSKMDQVFNDLFSEKHQLFHCPIKSGMLLAAAILCRGQVSLSELRNNLDRLGKSLKFAPWNSEGWKLGLCNIPPVGCLRSLLMLTNTTEIANKFEAMREKFFKMYQKKAHIHHFLEVDSDIRETFNCANNTLTKLITDYKAIESLHNAQDIPRPRLL